MFNLIAYRLEAASTASDGSIDTLTPTLGPSPRYGRSPAQFAGLFGATSLVRAEDLDWIVDSSGMPSYPDVYRLVTEHENGGYIAVCSRVR